MKTQKVFLTSALAFIMVFAMAMTMLMGVGSVTAYAEEITTPTIVSVGGIEVDQEENMGGAPTAIIGQPYSTTVVATGGGITFSAGAGEYMKLPEGLSINAETGVISGTCTEAEMGRFNVYIKASNTAGEASAVIGLWVVDDSVKPVIQTAAGSLGSATVDSYTNFTVSVQGSANFLKDIQWTLKSGAIPTGMKLNYSNTQTVYISGTPTVAGTYTFTLQVENEIGSAEREFSITINAGVVAPHILDDYTSALPYAVVGQAYNLQLHASGTDTQSNPIVWSFNDTEFSQDSYDLGKGLTLSNTGLISGTPTENGQISLDLIYAKNSAGQNFAGPYLQIYNDGTITSVAVSPAETVVQKTKTKQFTAEVLGYGEVNQSVTWDTSMYIPALSGWAPRPTSDDTTLVNGLLTIGEDEERAQIYVVAIASDGSTKGYAVVTVADKAAEVFTVTFDENGGTGIIGPFEYIDGYEYTLPANTITAPSKKHFLNWEVKIGSAEAAAKNPGDTITVTANTTVKAIWESDPVPTYTVTYQAGEGTGADYIVNNVEEDTTHALVSFTTAGFTAPNGYRFLKWSVDGTQKAAGDEITVSENKTIIALYELIPAEKYTVTYQANGGVGNNYAVENVDAGSEHQLVALATAGFTAPDGKQFKCWSVSGSEKAVGATITVNENTTVLAIWENIPSEEPEYQYDVVDGVRVYSDTLTLGQAKDLAGLFAEAKAQSGKVDLTVGNLSLTFDANAVNALGGETVSLMASLSTENLTIDGAQLVIDINLTGASANFGNGKVTVSVPFTTAVPEGKVAKVYYVNENDKTDMNATFADGKVTFETPHFSTFAVVFEDEQTAPVDPINPDPINPDPVNPEPSNPEVNPAPEKKGLSGGAIAGIVIAIVVVLAGAGVGVFFLLKKKGVIGGKKADEPKKEDQPKDESDE